MRYLFQDMAAMSLVCQGVSGHHLVNALNLTRTLCNPLRRHHQWEERELNAWRAKELENFYGNQPNGGG